MTDPISKLSDVSRETLERFEALVLKWNKTINLVAGSTLTDIRNRHIGDSVHLSSALAGTAATWVDLGAGGGFPGIIVSILRPETRVILLESDQRKAAFLRTARRELDLNAEVISRRIEEAAPLGADVVSARALAPLPLLLAYAARHGGEGARFLFSKGEAWESEHELASITWSYDLDVIDGPPESNGKILHITNLRQRNE